MQRGSSSGMQQVQQVEIRTSHVVSEALGNHSTPTLHARANDLGNANQLHDQYMIHLTWEVENPQKNDKP